MEIRLTGEWKLAFDDGDEGLSSKWYEPGSFPGLIKLHIFPTFVFSPEQNGSEIVWAKKEFEVDNVPEGYLYLVFFLADQGMVWLNGKKIGELKQTGKKQMFDVTSHLEKHNTLIVRFHDLKPESLMIGKEVYLMDNTSVPAIGRTFVRHTPKWVDSAVIYEIFTRNFTEEGNFAGVIKKIPYLKQIGVNTLWFMPIHPLGEIERKGGLGSPYSIKDYYAISEDLGTEEDFRKVVHAAHDAGMKVIIDLVINHTAHDSVMMEQDPRFFKPSEHNTAEAWGWTDVTQLDYDYPKTREYIREMMAYWIREFDIDGYRCDVAFLVPLDFWKTAIDYLRSIKKDILMLAEADNPELYAVGFDLTYDWVYMGMIRRMAKGLYKFEDLIDYILSQYEYYPQNARRLICLENHDTQRIADVIPDSDKLFYHILKYITPGVPLIYNGEEFGARGFVDLFDSCPLDWSHPDLRLVELYKKLAEIKRCPGLNYHNRDGFDIEEKGPAVRWIRRDMNENLDIQIDFSNRSVVFSNEQKTGTVIEGIIGEDSLLFTGNRL